ncbi:uncharacterized protein EV420DRAFT_1182622 [Desarmillaria tabescens]|uniref:F-box domain-containing protein n=1 Tax=Armillaria tabescens TaxID=1929756 RepID=A0AA39NB26_ARMTA|nr:uncharacterized protein EV420DRAFT_1182622 [Desarmillaria tabescens]KAK0462355.1 hypothetical protein EV420DRAFT_1182622 [Desarmillaria tabescens]
MTGTPLSWSHCTGCTCPNHQIPSYEFSPDRHTLKPLNLARLAHSNDSPSDAEEAVLRKMLSSYDAELQNIDTEQEQLTQFIAEMKSRISLAEQKVDDLYKERHAISAAILERKQLLNPIRRFPAEILLRIFSSTIVFPIPRFHTDGDEAWGFLPPENSIWTIETVCKRWRTVALDFPELWSSINIVITDTNFGDDSRGISYVHRIGTQLNRSKNRPLSLTILNDEIGSSFAKLPPAIVAILFSFSTCIERLHLYVPPVMFAHIPSLHLSLPSLTDLCLLPTVESIDEYQGLKLFHCPMLHRLHTVDIPQPCHSFDLSWGQIATFTSDHALYAGRAPGLETQSALRIFQNLTSMSECYLRLELVSTERSWVDEHLDTVESQIHVLSLSSWRFKNHTPVKELLDKLILPVLQQLYVKCSIDDADRDDEETFAAIYDVLRRSGQPSITTLHFDHGDILEEDLLQILSTCPTLEDVRLTDVDEGAISNETLLRLTLKVDGTEPLIPRLHTLHISGPMLFSMQIFVNMVESRWTLAHVQSPSVRRLDEVNLCRFLKTGDEPDGDEVERITTLSVLDVYKTQGMDLTLTTKV